MQRSELPKFKYTFHQLYYNRKGRQEDGLKQNKWKNEKDKKMTRTTKSLKISATKIKSKLLNFATVDTFPGFCHFPGLL